MKKVVARGLFFVLTALFAIYCNPMITYSENIKTAKFEPLDAQMIMDILVRESNDSKKEDTGFTYDEAQMLMKIAMAEAEADGIEGKAMVMAVVLNRVNDPRFPDDIEGVLFQEHQFSPISDGRYYEAVPDVECHLALAEIEKGTYEHIDALYFENADSSWQSKACKYLYTVGHHRFYKN